MKRIIVTIIGGLVLLAGVAMIILPGPAFIVIPAGLAMLATEYDWARSAMRRAQACFKRFRSHPVFERWFPFLRKQSEERD